MREETDALPGSVHDWDGSFSVSVDRVVSAGEIDRRRGFKKQAIDALEKTLSVWRESKNTFEQNVELELKDSARILTDHYADKAARLLAGDASALAYSPIDADTVGDMVYILGLKAFFVPAKIGDFFNSKHFAEVPSQAAIRPFVRRVQETLA
jgi:hypothetical protein